MIYTFEDCALDTQRITLRCSGQSVRLRPKVFQMLTYLLEHRDRVVSKDELCEQVWPDQFISDATLESTIRSVRRAVGDSGRTQRIIETLHGHGYRFVAAVETRPEARADDVSTTAPAAVAGPSETAAPISGSVEQPLTILVVDDEIKIVKRMEALLLPRGYRVITASNGAEALQQTQTEHPDLVLLDVMMPVMDGFEVCRRIKDDTETNLIPVVLMTALGKVEDRVKGLEAGADDFLTKPVHRDELLARIRTSLRLKQTIDHKVDALQHARQHPTAPPLFLTLLRQGDTIIADLTEADPVAPRGEIQIEAGLLSAIDEELARIVSMANTQQARNTADTEIAVEQTDDAHVALRRLGGLISSHLLPASARQGLLDSSPTDLFLRLDAQLVHLPWELSFNGQDFLFNKFRIGRQVMTQQRHIVQHTRDLQDSDVLNMLLVVDPTECLPTAGEAAEQLCHMLATCQNLKVSEFRGKQLRKIDLLLALNEYDLVHYIGRARFDAEQPGRSGWHLHDAVLTTLELGRVARAPLLVFANTCQPGATPRRPFGVIYEGQAFGIGSAFLLAGTQHYIGSFCVAHDGHSTALAADFYRRFLSGERIGDALSAARDGARQNASIRDLRWASYIHYGNPTFQLPNHEA